MAEKSKIMSTGTNMPSQVRYVVPDGDNRVRAVCDACGFINYINPRVVVGAVISFQEKILLCRRAIEPRRGLWTIPAGYLEEKDTAEEGALREILEEAGVRPRILGLLSIYSLSHISQIQIIYKAELGDPHLDPGIETTEAKLFPWNTIPWSELAFPSVSWALKHFREVGNQTVFSPKTNPND